MSDSKYFKLGPKQSIFWDPTQPKLENQKLVGNQIKELELTTAVATAKRMELIVAVDEKEVEQYLKNQTATSTVSADSVSKEEHEKALKTLAEEHEKALKTLAEELESILNASKKEYESKVRTLETEIKALKEQLNAKEAVTKKEPVKS